MQVRCLRKLGGTSVSCDADLLRRIASVNANCAILPTVQNRLALIGFSPTSIHLATRVTNQHQNSASKATSLHVFTWGVIIVVVVVRTVAYRTLANDRNLLALAAGWHSAANYRVCSTRVEHEISSCIVSICVSVQKRR